MPKTIFAALATAILLVTGGGAAHATDLRDVLADSSVSSWTKKDGLPPGTIRTIAQDADGFLWLGGDFGLVRFDGARFVRADALGLRLPQGSVQTLHASGDGSLWVGFASQVGISRITRNHVITFGAPDGLRPGAVTAIVEDRTGGVVAVSDGGLFRFLDNHWAAWNIHYGPEEGRVRTAYVGPSGDLLLVADVGIFRRRPGEEGFEQLENNDAESRVQDIVEDRAGHIWVTDLNHGFRSLDQRQARVQPLGVGKGYRLLTDQLGHLWVATLGQGLWRARTEGPGGHAVIERATDLTGLSNNSPSALLEDRDGNIWAGTSDGLNRVTPHSITEITNLGLATGLDVTPDGHVFVGTANGVVLLAGQQGTWHPGTWYLRGIETRAMHVDARGTVWVATDRGLYRISGRAHGPTADLIDSGLRRIVAIASGPRDDLFLYDLDRGLVRSSGGHAEPVALPGALARTRVATMFTDRTRRAWIGFAQGQIAVIDVDGTLRSYGVNDGLPGGLPRAIYEDESGTVWIAGSLGLSRFNNGQFVTLREISGAPMNVNSIISDDTGLLWFGNPSGIVRMSRGEYDRAVTGRSDPNYHLLDMSDGVAGTAGWIGQRSAIRADGGRLWFLTGRSLAIVDPRALRARQAPEAIQLDGVIVDDRQLEAATPAGLPASTTRLEIKYTTPDLTSSLKTRFRYRLDGFDKDWVDAGTQRQALYTNLPRRSYVFRVQANNEDGAWVRPSATWAFSIQPRFYETRLFYGLVFALLVLAVCALWQHRMMQMRRQFALLLGERVRLSREIHDTLLQSLVGVTLQLDHLGNELELSPKAARQQFIRMRKQVEEYIREARQSIWNLRSSTLQRCDLVAALRQNGERAGDNNIAFDLKVMGTPRRHLPEVEEQVLRIGQEAVANAIQHAHARRIEMELHYDDTSLTLRVCDDGRGFEPGAVPGDRGHCGVISMRERAATVGGVLHISSAEGAGTFVEATLPTASTWIA